MVWPFSTIAALKRELADSRLHAQRMSVEVETLANKLEIERRYSAELADAISRLETELAEARKNDRRDPKTGRFTKEQTP